MSRLVSTEKDMRFYFKGLVDEAVVHQALDVTEISKFYLVTLLDGFAKTERLFDWKTDHYEETPLAMLLSEAMDSDPTRRVRAFKKLGDISLYVSGYFSDHIDSKMVDIDYYISMGEGAYKNLSGILSGEKTFSELYDELSIRFMDLMDILAEVRMASGEFSNTDLIRMYERWIKTGDSRIRERLEKEGIVPKKIDLKNH